MKRLGIKYQILLITLLPVFLIDLFFTYTHINAGIEKENELLRTKSHIIARQVAGAAEFSLVSGDDRQIQYLLDQTVGNDEILRASVYDRQGQLIAESENPDFQVSETPEYLYQRQPILSQSIEHSDVFTPDLKENSSTRILGWVNLYLSRQQVDISVRHIVIDAIVFFVSVLIVALLLTIIISRGITQPIFTLIDHLRQVETGQLGKIIEPTEQNEIGAVQKGFNRMTQSLLTNRRHLNQRIQQATRQLNEAITDLESKNRELGFARDQAQDANRTKSAFLANMSHEIRTPINGIRGFIHLLGQSNLDHTQRRYIDIIQKSTDDLTNIVNEVLDFSKMESGKLHIFEEPFDLYDVIEQTRDILFINVLTKNIDLNLIIFSDTPRLLIGDKLRLKQILLNLIGNAIKFTDRGRVVIRVSLLDERDNIADIEISVEDTGIGISEVNQQHLFQAFSQVESSDTRRFPGTGLGLAISKNLANLMDGDISMHSRVGEGSKFVLQLPFRMVEDREASLQEDENALKALVVGAEKICLTETRTLFERAGVVVESLEIGREGATDQVLDAVRRNRAHLDLLVIDLRHLAVDFKRLQRSEITGNLRTIVIDYDRGIDPQPDDINIEFASVISTSQSIQNLLSRNPREQQEEVSKTAPAYGEPRHVLLVDDNEVNLTLASELIRLWGHRVTESGDSRRALELFSQEAFDLVILDIQMPEIDGISLMRMMRERDPDNPVPIAALTANVLDGEAERLLELGFDYFLSKPIEERRFRALLDGAPERRKVVNPAASESPSGENLSIDYAGSLALCANNDSLLRQIFEIIRRDIPRQRSQLGQALLEADRDKISAITHKLQGVTCYASLPRLKQSLFEFQQRFAGGDLPLDEPIHNIVSELEAIEAVIARYLAEPDAANESA